MSPLSQCRSQNALPPDASTSRLQSPQPPAPANPSYTACPSHPPESSGEKESAFSLQGNPLRLVFLGTGSRAHTAKPIEFAAPASNMGDRSRLLTLAEEDHHLTNQPPRA